eukprot:Awhi_evm1s15314
MAGCNAKYEGDQSKSEDCVYHPGQPLFHEGMKSWTCCERKTSDFQSFLNQVGCETGSHSFVPPKTTEVLAVDAKLDYFQTDSQISLSIFTKNANPDESRVEVTSNK